MATMEKEPPSVDERAILAVDLGIASASYAHPEVPRQVCSV